MKFHHVTIDEFLERPDMVREWALMQEFKTEISPADGLEYPGIVKDLPDFLLSEVHFKLSITLGEQIEHVLGFMRMTLEGYQPHAWIHSDPRIADWIAVTYLNTESVPYCGTAMYEHRTGLVLRSPRTVEEQAIWERDCQNELDWRMIGWVQAKYNRTIIFNTHTLHAAHPRVGHGEGVEDGRLVMVNFFNLRVREEPCVQPQQQQLELPLRQSQPSELRSQEP